MRFCPKCETRLRPEPGEEIIACPKCGFKTKRAQDEKPKIQESKKTGTDGSLTVMEGETIDALPTTSIECPQCKHDMRSGGCYRLVCDEVPHNLQVHKSATRGATMRSVDIFKSDRLPHR